MLFAVLCLALSIPSLVVGAAVGLAVAAAVGAAVALRLRRRVAASRVDAALSADLVEQAPDVVLVHAPDGTGLSPNAAARTALGLGGDGRLSLLDAVSLNDQQAARTHLAALDGGQARTDLKLRSPGSERTFDVVSKRVGDRVLTVARDVSGRVTREHEARRERDEARAAVRDKSAFLDAMSHDLRTPLTAVLGFAELLRDDVDEDSRGLVEAIETGGQRLLRTLNAVLDLARLDAGRHDLHPVALDAVATVDRVVANHQASATARGLTLSVEAFSDHVPATIDANVIGRIVDTLVGNAVAFTETGGVTVEVVDDPETVTVRVLDTGSGIPADVMPTLFSEHRHQPGGAGHAPVGVTALGLAVARRLADLAGGSLSAESRWGQGSAFTVVLPRGPIPEMAPTAVAA